MACADSHDLRIRVPDAVRACLSRRAAALPYRVSIATVIRWSVHVTTTGATRAQRQGCPPGSKLDAHEDFLLALTEDKDDITLADMQQRLRAERSL